MATQAYIGSSQIAHRVTGIYIGINTVAQKICKAYIGDENGKARLCWASEPAWVPSSITNRYDMLSVTSL